MKLLLKRAFTSKAGNPICIFSNGKEEKLFQGTLADFKANLANEELFMSVDDGKFISFLDAEAKVEVNRTTDDLLAL
jgi:hypothetical protein